MSHSLFLTNKKIFVPLLIGSLISKGTNIFALPPLFILSSQTISQRYIYTWRSNGRFPFNLRKQTECSELIFVAFPRSLFSPYKGLFNRIMSNYSSLQCVIINLRHFNITNYKLQPKSHTTEIDIFSILTAFEKSQFLFINEFFLLPLNRENLHFHPIELEESPFLCLSFFSTPPSLFPYQSF